MYATLFISQSLRSVCIQEDETLEECATAELIRSLAYKAPWLRSLQIQADPETDLVDRTLSRLSGTFKYLTSFSISSELSSTTLMALGSLPDLASLSCSVDGAVERHLPPLGPEGDTPFFPALQELQLAKGYISPMPCHFLANLSHSPLRKLVIRSHITFDDLGQLVLTLQGLPPLEHLRIETSGYGLVNAPTATYSSVLRPLKPSHLQKLELLAAPFKITDDCVKDVATAFPGLTDLILDNGLGTTQTTGPQVTFNGLLTLVARCPKLQTFQLPVYFDDATRAHLAQRPLQRYISLRKAEVANIRARDPSVLAAVLSGIFPNASFAPSGCIYQGETLSSVAASWRQVQINLDLFNLARQQMLDS